MLGSINNPFSFVLDDTKALRQRTYTEAVQLLYSVPVLSSVTRNFIRGVSRKLDGKVQFRKLRQLLVPVHTEDLVL